MGGVCKDSLALLYYTANIEGGRFLVLHLLQLLSKPSQTPGPWNT